MNSKVKTVGLLAAGAVVGAVAVRVGQDYLAKNLLPIPMSGDDFKSRIDTIKTKAADSVHGV